MHIPKETQNKKKNQRLTAILKYLKLIKKIHYLLNTIWLYENKRKE